jgi:hypothetical protein
MAFTKLTDDISNISKLSNLPNIDDGLTPALLKAEFDKAGNSIKAFVNGVLTEEIDTNLATKAELAGVVLGDIPDASLTAVKFAPNALQADNTQLSTATAAAYGVTEVDSALKKLSNKTELNTLPLNLFYDGTVHDIAGAFIYNGATAVSATNLYATLTTIQYYPAAVALFMTKPIYIDKYASTAKIEVTYILSGQASSINLAFNLPVVGTVNRGSSNTTVDFTQGAKSVELPASSSSSTVTLSLDTLAYLNGTVIPLYLYFPLSTPYYGGGTTALTISKIELKNS